MSAGPEKDLKNVLGRAAEFEDELTTDAWLEQVREAEQPRAVGRLGGFELVEEVGRGRRGIVYKARREGASEPVAVKRLLAGPHSGRAAGEIEKALAGGASLEHPAVVSASGVEHVGDRPLVVMPWIDGEPINLWARERAPDQILEVFCDACDGVRHAHESGVIHRDLKPNNILVDRENRPRILDFGFAPVAEGGPRELDREARTSLFVGTPAYAAPEQVAGNAADARSDVYSLGVVLHEALTGRMPYPEAVDVPDLFRQIEGHHPEAPSRLTPRLSSKVDAVVLKALAKDPERRHESVAELVAELRGLLDGGGVLGAPPGAGRRLALVAVIVLLLIVVVIAVVSS